MNSNSNSSFADHVRLSIEIGLDPAGLDPSKIDGAGIDDPEIDSSEIGVSGIDASGIGSQADQAETENRSSSSIGFFTHETDTEGGVQVHVQVEVNG